MWMHDGGHQPQLNGKHNPYLLTSHAQSRINSFTGQAYNLINRGLSKFHASTIASITDVPGLDIEAPSEK